MAQCLIDDPHPPHCPDCGGPADFWVYDNIKPITAVGKCQANCADTEACDGGLLSLVADWEPIKPRKSYGLGQNILDASRLKTNQCLVEPGCSAKAIDAHTVPDNWMRLIEPKDVYLFAPGPKPTGPPGAPQSVPHKVNIRRATTTGFACANHDQVFTVADQREGDLTSQNRLNLLFYRAILKALHGELLAETLSKTHIGAAVKENGGTLFNNSRVETFGLTSSLLRTTTTYPVLNWRISHITRFIPGAPRIACSNAGTWNHRWIDFLNAPAQMVEALARIHRRVVESLPERG